MQHVRHAVTATYLAVSVAGGTGVAYAGNGVIIEAVNNYSACNGPSIPTAIADATGFRNEITVGSPWHGGFTSAGQYTDGAVYTSDFADPQRTTQSDYDHVYFDKPGLAFSYYAGHGVGGKGDTCWSPARCYNSYQPCQSATSCNQPLAGSGYPAICRRDPGDTGGWCSYTAYDRTMALGNCTSGPPNRNGLVNYSSTFVKWGESSASGAWGGAGTNGGTNVVVLSMSHPHRSSRAHELIPAFAGAQLILSPLVHWGDSFIHASRGYWFAKQAENPNASVANAFLASMASLGGAGNACTNSSGTATYGGGFGVNGCGGAVSMTVDASSSWALSNLARSFVNIQNDAYKSFGSGWHYYNYSCNYDCNKWSMSLP